MPVLSFLVWQSQSHSQSSKANSTEFSKASTEQHEKERQQFTVLNLIPSFQFQFSHSIRFVFFLSACATSSAFAASPYHQCSSLSHTATTRLQPLAFLSLVPLLLSWLIIAAVSSLFEITHKCVMLDSADDHPTLSRCCLIQVLRLSLLTRCLFPSILLCCLS